MNQDLAAAKAGDPASVYGSKLTRAILLDGIPELGLKPRERAVPQQKEPYKVTKVIQSLSEFPRINSCDTSPDGCHADVRF